MAAVSPTDPQLKKALVYIPFFGWIPALAFLFSEKDEYVRWHAAQSLVLHAIVAAVYWIALPALRLTVLLSPVAWFLQGAVGVGFVLLMLYVLVQVHQGKQYKIPLVAEWADKLVARIK